MFEKLARPLDLNVYVSKVMQDSVLAAHFFS